MAGREDLEAPLLPPGSKDGFQDTPPPSNVVAGAAGAPPSLPNALPARCGGRCSTSGGVANLVTTAVGAGMVALPRAVSEVGVLAGMALFVLTAALTLASTSIIIKYASQYRTQSYGDLIRLHFGGTGATVLQLAIVTHVAGVMIGYCVIIADILVGSAPHYTGMLPTLLARHDNPWWLSRPAVLAALVLTVILPLLVPRNLASVARFSRFSVGMVMFLAASIASLALTAAAEGRLAPDVRLLPHPDSMGGGTPLGILGSLLTVVSVTCLAYSCHFNLLPIKASLKDPSCPSMLRVTQLALAVCAAIYGAVAVSGYVLFGSATDGDVLKNLTAKAVGQLVPGPLAHALVYFIALAFTFNLLVNFVLKVWAVRENLCELALGLPALQLAALPFYTLTLALVAAAYGISVMVPSVYALLALVGSTACVTFSYIFPGLLLLRCGNNSSSSGGNNSSGRGSGSLAAQAGGVGLIVLGVTMAAVSVYNRLSGHGGE